MILINKMLKNYLLKFIFLTFFFSVVVHHKEINVVLKIDKLDFDKSLQLKKF